MLAKSVEEASLQCNPESPLVADDPRYVDLSVAWGLRQAISKTICRTITRSGSNYGKYLVSGHRGCGKSTELLRLKKCLEDSGYLCIYMDIEHVLDPVSISYTDIFIGLIDSLTKVVVEEKISLDTKNIETIINWFNTEALTEKIEQSDIQGNIETSAQGEVGIPLLLKFFSKFSGHIKHGSTWRTTSRTKIEKKGSEFIQLINDFIESIREKIKEDKNLKDLVFIVDGLEKIHFQQTNGGNTHSDLFVKQADQLKSLKSNVIYTMPISLAYDRNLGNDFDEMNILPMVNINQVGQELLLELVKKRIDINSVFEYENLVKELIKASGGVARDLIRLIKFACTEVDDGNKIDLTATNMAITKLTRELDRIICNQDVDTLREVHKHQRASVGTDTMSRLLLARIILEYQNGRRWASVHPCALKIDWLKDEIERSD